MKTTGQAGKTHWTPSNASVTAPLAHGHHNQRRSIGVFTTDIALKEDPEYFKIVEEFSEDEDKFLEEFAKAWYKLTTRDMGTRARCANTDAPPPQSWQYPLPASDDSHSEHWDDVKTTIKSTLLSGSEKNLGLMIRLGWQCMSTYRDTDHLGGCNGARIRWMMIS